MYSLSWLRCILSSAYLIFAGAADCYPVLSVESISRSPVGADQQLPTQASVHHLTDAPEYGRLFAACSLSVYPNGLKLFDRNGTLLGSTNSVNLCRTVLLKQDKLFIAARFDAATTERILMSIQKNIGDTSIGLTLSKKWTSTDLLELCQVAYPEASSSFIYCFSQKKIWRVDVSLGTYSFVPKHLANGEYSGLSGNHQSNCRACA